MNLEISNKESPFKDFKRIATSLMSDHVLIVSETTYRFTSLEFYYFEKDNHPDIYSHQHAHQSTSGEWYFHGSGLDITFGSEGVYGGILIRGIKHLNEKKYFNGPLICVQELFKGFGSVNNDKMQYFYIAEIQDKMGALMEEQNVYYSRRVGLNKKVDKSEGGRFYNGMYRFFINPKETQKDKGNIAVDLLEQGKSKKDINDLFGYQHFKQPL